LGDKSNTEYVILHAAAAFAAAGAGDRRCLWQHV